jgi:hypothetical protein
VTGVVDDSDCITIMFSMWAQLGSFLPEAACYWQGAKAHRDKLSNRRSIVHRNLREESARAEELSKEVVSLKASDPAIEAVKREYLEKESKLVDKMN